MLQSIKKWQPRHEQIVALHIVGWSNVKIAEHFDITPIRVSQVLSDPQARSIVRSANLSMRKKMEEDIQERLIVLSEKSVQRLEETICEGEFVLGSDAKKHQDNISLSVLKGVGFLPGAIENGERKNTPPLSESLASRLVVALEKSNEAEKLNRESNEIVVEVKDAEIISMSPTE